MIRASRPFVWNILVLGIAFGLSIAIGAVYIPPVTQIRIFLAHTLGFPTPDGLPDAFSTILYQIRLPHTILVVMAGAALASSGAAYQGLFRNPLADPYLLGVAAGAGLGAILAMTVHWPADLAGLYGVPASAFIFALIMVFVVYGISRVDGGTPATTLILAGVAAGSFATALTSFLMLRSTGELHRSLSWLLGGGLLAGWQPIIAMAPYLATGIACLVLSGHSLNVLQFGDEQAQQLGLPVQRRKLIIIIAATLTTAAAVSFAGIIGFIGLIVPHVVRMLWGSDYRRVIPLSILGGSSALLLADIVARVVLAPQVIPVGIVTALAGAPFFLWLLRRSKSSEIG
jgi:iron complex transport system permease protein